MKNHGSNYKTIHRKFDHEGIDYSKFKGNFGKGMFRPFIPIDEILVTNSTFNRTHLKERLLKDNLIDNRCQECGLADTWNGKSITLVLDTKIESTTIIASKI